MKNILTYSLVALVIIALIILSYFFIKPNHTGIDENPYSMKMDSLGEIPKDKFCATNYSSIPLEGTKSEAIAVDKNNNIYASSDKKIICFDTIGNPVSEINCDYLATALAFTNDKLIAAFTNEISIFDATGKQLINWKLKNEKSYITSLAAIDGNIYAADAQAAKVYCFSEEGKLLKTIGQTDYKKELTFFVLPSFYFDVAIDTDKSIWIANTGRHKLVQLDNDEHIISSWGETSSAVEGFCGCCNPSNFALMRDGSVEHPETRDKSDKTEHMIAMQVRNKNMPHTVRFHIYLAHTNLRSLATINHVLLVAHLHNLRCREITSGWQCRTAS